MLGETGEGFETGEIECADIDIDEMISSQIVHQERQAEELERHSQSFKASILFTPV